MTTEHTVFLGKTLSAAGIVLILLAGWLFSMLVNVQQQVRERQDTLVERVAQLETKVDYLESGCAQ